MSTESTPPAKPRRRAAIIAAAAGGGALLLVGGAYGVGYALMGQTLPPQTTIEGVAVGGMSADEAATVLTEAFADRADAEITLTAGKHELTKPVSQWGLSLDVSSSVEAALPDKSLNPAIIWSSLLGGSDQAAVTTRDLEALKSATDDLGQLANIDPENAAISIADAKATLAEGRNGETVNAAATQDALVSGYLHADTVKAVVDITEPEVTTTEAQSVLDEVAIPAMSGPITLNAEGKSVELTPDMIGAALSFTVAGGTLEPRLDPEILAGQAEKPLAGFGLKAPEDATIKMANGKPVVVPSTDGKGVSTDELVRAVSETMRSIDDRSTDVAITDAKAEFTTEDAEKMGVKEITGEFSTSFPASAYRINNIGKSASLINNTFLKPGETFDMNQTLGQRTVESGWMSGGAIDGGKVVQRMGGGISQTTTTLFNAIFFAGLEDIYHKPHSLYFSRYPMGREATLDWHSVDMKFKNDSDYGVLIQAFTNNPSVGGTGKVTVRIWSTKVYDVKASDPVQSDFRSPGATIHDDSPGCVAQSAMSGFTVNYNRLFYQNGKLVRTEPFTWTYNSLTPVVCD